MSIQNPTPQFYAALAKQVAKRRDELKMSQAELALRTGASQANISRIEKGEASAMYHTIVAVARVLDIDLDKLHKFIPDKRQEKLL